MNQFYCIFVRKRVLNAFEKSIQFSVSETKLKAWNHAVKIRILEMYEAGVVNSRNIYLWQKLEQIN